MRKAFLIVMLAVFLSGNLFMLMACTNGSGNIIKDERNIAGFDKIVLESSGNVIITQGDTEKVIVETDDNIVELITTEVMDNTLIISSEKSFSVKKLNIYVFLKNIEGVKVNGSGDISSTNSLHSEIFAAIVDGSGDINLEIESRGIKCEVNGSGDIKLTGIAENLICTVKGSGDIGLSGLNAKNGKVSVYGSGDCSVYTENSLEASIYGSGDINYFGNPRDIKTKVNGSGDINKMD